MHSQAGAWDKRTSILSFSSMCYYATTAQPTCERNQSTCYPLFATRFGAMALACLFGAIAMAPYIIIKKSIYCPARTQRTK